MQQEVLTNEQLANVARSRRLHRKPAGKAIVSLWDLEGAKWLREHQAHGALFARCGPPLVIGGRRYMHTTNSLVVTVREEQHVRWPLEDGTIRIEARISKHRASLTPLDFAGRPVLAVIRRGRSRVVETRLIVEGEAALDGNWEETVEDWRIPSITAEMLLHYNVAVI